MKKNTQWFSIMIGMGLTMLILLSAYVILWYIIPFMKSVKGIENTASAYYQASSGIESALWHMSTSSGTSVVRYDTVELGNTAQIPNTNVKGNSEYDTWYNQLSERNAIQIEVGKGKITNWSQVAFYFQIPVALNLEPSSLKLKGGIHNNLISWSLWNDVDTLSSTWTDSIIQVDKIPKSDGATPWYEYKIQNQDGATLTGSTQKFADFYTNHCMGAGSGCTLRMALLQPLQLSNWKPLPYLEYKLDFCSILYSCVTSQTVPDMYVNIKSSGVSYGFQKNLEVNVPQQVINQSLDFTVYQ